MRLRVYLLALAVLACAPPGTGTGLPLAVEPSQLTLDGVSAGMREDEVRAARGEPDSVGDLLVAYEHGPTSAWHYGALEVGYFRHEVVLLRCRAPGCRTARGITVGDTVAAVLAAYGPSSARRADGELATLFYQGPAACQLIFWLRRGRIEQSGVSCARH